MTTRLRVGAAYQASYPACFNKDQKRLVPKPSPLATCTLLGSPRLAVTPDCFSSPVVRTVETPPFDFAGASANLVPGLVLPESNPMLGCGFAFLFTISSQRNAQILVSPLMCSQGTRLSLPPPLPSTFHGPVRCNHPLPIDSYLKSVKIYQRFRAPFGITNLIPHFQPFYS